MRKVGHGDGGYFDVTSNGAQPSGFVLPVANTIEVASQHKYSAF